MEYVRHKYSKRIYQIMTDHGPDHPYLWSPWEFSTRYLSQSKMTKFFSPCEKPAEMPRSYPTSITQELEWENRQLAGSRPLRVEPPVTNTPPKVKEPSLQEAGEYTLRDLCGEIGMDPAKARKLLRSKGKTSPQGGWKWASKEEAKPIRRFLKKF